MKYTSLLTIVLMLSCSMSKKMNGGKTMDYEILQNAVESETGTTAFYEMRFYKIDSSNDAPMMMYLDYGEWTERYTGKYQDNIDQLVWKGISLGPGIDNVTVITDGTETEKEYFTSFIVLDKNRKDCLNPNHPLRDLVKNALVKKQAALIPNRDLYRLF